MKTKLRAIEHRAVSGVWLLGDDFEEIIISDETYQWLWRNIYTICDSSRLVKMFWANTSQYFDYRLNPITPDYFSHEGKIVAKNKEQIDKRNEERNRFLEFHYALGGLLLYREKYKTLDYIFHYSQSQPPKYVLLPETTTEIFHWFENFRNEFKHNTPIDTRYYYPELDNLGNRRQVNYWICSYIAILFLRQYSLHQYYTYQDFTAQPNLPNEVLELSSWLDSISYFEMCLKDVLSNKELLTELRYEKLIEESSKAFSEFTSNLKEAIKNKIGEQKLNAELSEDKINQFYTKSKEIIRNAFDEYKSIFIEKTESHLKSELKLSLNGERTLMSKSAFTDNDIPHLNYDSVFAGSIATNKIKRLIPNAFLIAKTKRYLLNKSNVISAISKIIAGNNDIIIIGINLDYQLKRTLDKSNYKNIIQNIPSTEYHSQNTLFILRKNDLPAIEHKDLAEDEKSELQLKCINEELKIYASIIDINKEENKAIKDKWNIENEPDNQDLKVQIAIAFLCNILWKDEREIIQISIASEYKEQGIQNELNDVQPMKNKDEKK